MTQVRLSDSAAAVSEDAVNWVRFTRVENMPMFARQAISPGLRDEVLAAGAHAAVSLIAPLRAAMEDVAVVAARSLIDESTPTHLDRLAAPGSTIAVVGDSITADQVGWSEILRALLAERFGDSVRFVNAALAGTTTTDTVERLDLIEAARADVVLMMIGTNDVRAQRLLPGEPLVSAPESARNVRLLAKALGRSSRRLVIFTPPPLYDQPSQDGVKAGAWGNSWCEEALALVAQQVRETPAHIVELQSPRVFDPRDLAVMEADGVHPTTQGHLEIVRRLLRSVAPLSPLQVLA